MLPEQLEDGLALIDATEQRVSRPGKNNEIRKLYFSGKQHEFTLKTQIATDGLWHIAAVSVPVPDAIHDKKLCDQLQTLERLPTGCEAAADKGYQGLVTDTVSTLSTRDVETGVEKKVPRSLLILLIVMVILRFYFIISEQVFFFFLGQSSHNSAVLQVAPCNKNIPS